MSENEGDRPILAASDLPYMAVTREISVSVSPNYLPEHSEPDRNHFVWAYKIRIENTGQETVQLINRHWQITDAAGRIQEVKGPGVVGEQPILAPGDSFVYSSGAPLSTPSGFMVGHYEMETTAGAKFSVDIPAFSLDSPFERDLLN